MGTPSDLGGPFVCRSHINGSESRCYTDSFVLWILLQSVKGNQLEGSSIPNRVSLPSPVALLLELHAMRFVSAITP